MTGTDKETKSSKSKSKSSEESVMEAEGPNPELLELLKQQSISASISYSGSFGAGAANSAMMAQAALAGASYSRGYGNAMMPPAWHPDGAYRALAPAPIVTGVGSLPGPSSDSFTAFSSPVAHPAMFPGSMAHIGTPSPAFTTGDPWLDPLLYTNGHSQFGLSISPFQSSSASAQPPLFAGTLPLGNALQLANPADILAEDSQKLFRQLREKIRDRLLIDNVQPEHLTALFSMADANGRGSMEWSVFRDILDTASLRVRDDDMVSLLRFLDKERNGLVDYVQFLRLISVDVTEMNDLLKNVADQLRRAQKLGVDVSVAFRRFDSDMDGYIHRNEFIYTCRQLGLSLSDADIASICDAFAFAHSRDRVCYFGFLQRVSALANIPLSAPGAVLHDRPLSASSNGTGSQPYSTKSHTSSTYQHQQYSVAPDRAWTQSVSSAKPTYAAVVSHAASNKAQLSVVSWICRVCRHEQAKPWTLRCEVCDTAKPDAGRAAGFLRCTQCGYENDADATACEICEVKLQTKSSYSSKSSSRRSPRRAASSPVRGSSSRSDRDSDNDDQMVSEGDVVDARLDSRDSWQRARVVRKNKRDGSVAVVFLDEGREEVRDRVINLSPTHIRSNTSEGRRRGGREDGKEGRSSGSRDEGQFFKGDKVELKVGNSRWVRGTIEKVRKDDSYDVLMEDGHEERFVHANHLRLRGKEERSDAEEDEREPQEFETGDTVEAEREVRGGKKKYAEARIVRVRDGGRYDVEFSDGEVDEKVSSKYLRAVEKSSKRRKDDGKGKRRSEYEVGSRVEARWKGKQRFIPGKVTRVRSDGSLDIKYESGDVEERVSEDLVRMEEESDAEGRRGKSKERSGRAKDEESGDDERGRGRKTKEKTPEFEPGEKIEAKFKGRSQFYPGVIKKARADGTYDIEYDDGERETQVQAEHIRALRESKSSKSKKGKADSDDEKEKPSKHSKQAAASSSEDQKSKGTSLKEGQMVEARFKGRSKYYTGKVSKVRSDGTYDIQYDDGEKEDHVSRDLIKLLDDDRKESPKKKNTAPQSTDEDQHKTTEKLNEGQKVEAKYKGRAKYYPGKISRVRSDGTYDIDYDDGEKEDHVARDLIKPLGGGKSSPSKKSSTRSSDDDKKKSDEKLKEGQKVEAKYKGRAKYYPGKISRVRSDGTYDIDYDDGEKEDHVSRDLIKPLEGGKSSPSKKGNPKDSDEDKKKADEKLKEGQKVEAKYKGRAKYYAGKISRVRSDGTYDIDYDDGEKEDHVARDLIRLLEDSKSSPSKKGSSKNTDDEKKKDGEKLKEGQKVEARFKGRAKFYPGKISKVRSDGTYDIDYDDGEKEDHVARDLIKSVEKSSPKNSEDDKKKSDEKLKEGQKVEAKYKGRAKYYPGKISRVRSDGTYDIDYDDGEKEDHVGRDLIRALDSGKSSPSKKGASKDSDEDQKKSDDKLKEGQKVEAKYKGRAKYYSGKISRVRSDGTYDIDYDDGEKEDHVARDLIKALDDGKSSPSKKGTSKDSDEDKKTGDEKLKEGQKVEAKFKGRPKYYPGKISRVRSDGTYDIDYDDGEKEDHVARNLIRSLDDGKNSPSKKGSSSKSSAEDDKLREGQKVEAKYKGRAKFYPGKISRVRSDGTYDIDYDDGEKEDHVARDLIRSLESSKTLSKDSDDDKKKGDEQLKEGQKVEAKYKGRAKYYPGKISRVRSDGTYDIDYDDGEKEDHVARDLIKALDDGKKSPSKKGTAKDSDDDRKRSDEKLKEGQKVEARYKGREKYYPGKISRVRSDGTYDIDYDDGEKEDHVARDLIRALDSGKKSSSKDSDDDKRKSDEKLKDGQKVEARYKGRAKYYPGKISRIRSDGTYDIDYDDGEKEDHVARDLIKSLDDGKSSPSKKGSSKETDDDNKKSDDKLKEGDKVEAKFKGRAKYYPGKVSRVRSDGTYDIDYDDGEKEDHVARDLIKKLGTSKDEDKKSDEKLKEGQKVEAKYKGRAKYYPGKISRVRSDGTYDIDYDDGEKEDHVARDLIRALNDGKSSPSKKASASKDSDGDDKKPEEKLKEGQKVEARFKGRAKYYPGKISRVRSDGTYDIDYDDGEKEDHVARDLIKSQESAKGSSKDRDGDEKLKEGQKVEAKYKGRTKYYPGKISRVRSDGTYDIDYDDGEKEDHVARDLIRPLDDGKKGSKDDDTDKKKGESKLKEGQKVEAKYKGRAKYYPGKISRVRSDGTYDIDYDDGEKEDHVARDLIKALDDGKSSPSKKGSSKDSDDDKKMEDEKFKEGQKVEAKYKGRAKYYPGKISRVRSDGTYDIDYDDGEKEDHVSRDLIKALDSGKSSPSKKGSSKDSENESKTDGKLKEGQKVEARYKGRAKYYPGKISRVRSDGTYDIDYDDGEKEDHVARDLIKSLDDEKGFPSKKGASKDSDNDKKSDEKLKEGQKVEARYKGRAKYHPGKISRVRSDGTYDIDYDDGEKEDHVARDLIKSLESGKDSPSKKGSSKDSDDDKRKGDDKLKEGQKVEARYKGRAKYYPGKISRVRSDGTYDIDYDDGEKEDHVARDLIKSPADEKTSPSKKGAAKDSEDEKKSDSKLKEGQKVEARYKGRAKYYPGRITRARADGTYDLDYDDGEKEDHVARDLIKALDDAKSSSSKKDKDSDDDRKKPDDKLREGQKVEARYKGRAKYYPGKITRVRSDGTYDIDYDDGEKEDHVARDLIKALEDEKRSPSKRSKDGDDEKLKEGQKVEAKYKGRAKYYPGKISRVRSDGTYDIDYDDGEKEDHVARDLIKPLEDTKKGSSSKDAGDDKKKSDEKLKEGQKVEARYKGRTKYYPGKISRVRSDGTYDIDYDDGEKEDHIAADLIRSLDDGKSSPSKKGSSAKDSDDDKKKSDDTLKEGDKVEARYKGRSKYYPGKITRVRSDGTFDIDYDDGEKEDHVARDLIKSLNGGKSSPSKKGSSSKDSDSEKKSDEKLKEGQKVEAKYKGRAKYYPGKITRVRSDGTYDIDYDDGEKEDHVARDLIKALDDGKSSPSKKGSSSKDSDDDKKKGDEKLKEGQKVEAKYKGRAKYYPGKISRVRSDGTYDIDYDDGEKEDHVARELIKALEDTKSSSSTSRKELSKDDDKDKKNSDEKLKEGQKVEARYKGRAKHYPGKISRVRSDGTYDIDYDDGEKEDHVARDLIKILDDGKSSPSKKKSSSKDSDDDKNKKSDEKLEEGQKVEARYKGRAKYYPGKISRARSDGTYDIDYDDGEKEDHVARDLIKALDSGKNSPSKKSSSDDKLKEGQKVEARYKGRAKYYPGKISRVRSDGTYDIDYDDGEKEDHVARDLIKPLEEGKSSSGKKQSSDEDDRKGSSKSFKEGQKVEARYKGRAKYYPGKISRARSDGTYDIDYDDGEKEDHIAADLIRAAGGDGNRSGDEKSPKRGRTEEDSKIRKPSVTTTSAKGSREV